MSLFSFGKSEPAPAANTPAAPSSTPPADTPNVEEPKDGLDKFSYLFDNKEDKGAKGQEEDIPPFDPMAALQDEEAINALLSRVDFKSSISEATQAKLADNDPSAMMDAMNDIAKAAYRTALVHNQTMTSRYVQDQSKVQDKHVSSKISQSLQDKDLERDLPEISNPLVALGVKPFVSELKRHNPNMDSKAIAAEVRGYLQELNVTVNPNSKPKGRNSADDDGVDWLGELGL